MGWFRSNFQKIYENRTGVMRCNQVSASQHITRLKWTRQVFLQDNREEAGMLKMQDNRGEIWRLACCGI